MRPVTLIDTSLCAAQYAIWGGHATGAMLLPILRRMGVAGFDAIDIMDGDVHGGAAGMLKENPWHRIRDASRHAPNAQLNAWVHARCMFGTAPLAGSVIDLAIRQLAAYGVGRVTCYDPLNDISAFTAPIRAARAAGLHACAAIVYSPSPALPAGFHADTARALAAMGAESICIWDPAGLLDPDSARTLIPAVRAAIGDRPLELRCHCRSGLAEIVYLEGVRAGANVLHTALGPLAGGPSLPPADYIVEHLKRDGIDTRVASAEVNALANYFMALAERHDFPLGEHGLRDFNCLAHQLPWPLIAEAEKEAAEAGLSARFGDVLAEAARVRADLGAPAMLRPIGAFVCRQAILNLGDKRYLTLDPGIVQYLSGAYGTPPTPIDRALMAQAKKMSSAVSESEPPELDALRAIVRTGSDEDVLLAAMCDAETLRELHAIASEKTGVSWIPADTPIGQLKAEIARRPWVNRLAVRKGAFAFETGVKRADRQAGVVDR